MFCNGRLVTEAEKEIAITLNNSITRDVALIIAAQKIGHYQIANYCSLINIALTLEQDKIASILEQTLREEEDKDIDLTEIAETEINPEADKK